MPAPGRKRSGPGPMYMMSMEATMEFYTCQPAWALEFLPDPKLPWRCSPPAYCVRRSKIQSVRGWDCKVCACEATAGHVFSAAHVKRCYWATYGPRDGPEEATDAGNWEPAVKGMLEDGQPEEHAEERSHAEESSVEAESSPSPL